MEDYMKKLNAVVMVLALMTPLASCTGQYSKGQSGAVMGGVGGAVVGQAIGKSTEATLIGVAVGSMLGYIVGNEMDKYDRQQLNYVYETGPSGRQSSWQNPDSGNTYMVTPQPAVQSSSGTCRKAEIQAVIDGRRETTYSTACRDASGQWVLQ